MKKVSAFIVDDSAVMRKVLTGILNADPKIEVLGSAADPIFAQEKMAANWPDVIILDVEMPRMDGITFLRKIMRERPTPVVICSTLTEKGAETTVEALAAGAVEIIAKPRLGLRDFLHTSSTSLTQAVKSAARAKVKAASPERVKTERPVRQVTFALSETTDYVVALGMSTGGTQALERVLRALGQHCPGIVVVQHMPEKFTAAFAQRLNQICPFEVKEATNGDRVRPGRVLIAPGGRHLQLKRSGAQYSVAVLDGPPVSRHKPSVDVLFRSVARAAGSNAIGVLMTGMGNDGARGLLEMREAGAVTAVQDKASSVVFGMPKEALALGAAEIDLPLDDIGGFICQGLRKG